MLMAADRSRWWLLKVGVAMEISQNKTAMNSATWIDSSFHEQCLCSISPTVELLLQLRSIFSNPATAFYQASLGNILNHLLSFQPSSQHLPQESIPSQEQPYLFTHKKQLLIHKVHCEIVALQSHLQAAMLVLCFHRISRSFLP